jgi:hypothetical protein
MTARALLLGLLLAPWALWAPTPLVAQQPNDLPGRELDYRAARSAYESARDAWSVVEKAWNDAVEEHARARRAGDREQEAVWLTRALDLARELEMHERRVADQDEARGRARRELVATLDRRIAALERERAGAFGVEAARLGALIEDSENRKDELEAEAQNGLRVELVYYEAIQYDPRDDRESLASKAELLRSKAEQMDSLIVQVDRELSRVGRQQRRARDAQSLMSGVERFGDIQAPGSPGLRAPSGDARASADSTGVARPAPTTEQQILELRILRAELESARSSFVQRAETFEKLLRSTI